VTATSAEKAAILNDCIVNPIGRYVPGRLGRRMNCVSR
jgi:hypothetical protein